MHTASLVFEPLDMQNIRCLRASYARAWSNGTAIIVWRNLHVILGVGFVRAFLTLLRVAMQDRSQ
eukprot:4096376-Amphidinium_carterae.1